MKILALEFSTRQRSAAVFANQSDVPRPPELPSPAPLVETVETELSAPLNLIERALQKAGLEREDINCLAIGLGPGSYTGIRSALSLAQGWQLALEIKTLGISTVEVLASQLHDEKFSGTARIAIDAQRNEFYLATYSIQAPGPKLLHPLRLAGLAEVQSLIDSGEQVIGPELDRWFPQARVLHPSAATLARLAADRTDFLPADQLVPIYLRDIAFVKAPPPRHA
jgi:tRNA threonylcarbamoyladenosine biosynthesis protein TsaB